MSGTSGILHASDITLKNLDPVNQPFVEESLTNIILDRIKNGDFKDYTLLSFIVVYKIDGQAEHVAFLRKGSGNIKSCHDDIGNVTLTFETLSLKTSDEVTLENMDDVIHHRENFNKSQVVKLTFVMMHKKAVECVQSYLDNSGGGGNDANCLSALTEIEAGLDGLVQAHTKFSVSIRDSS